VQAAAPDEIDTAATRLLLSQRFDVAASRSVVSLPPRGIFVLLVVVCVR